MEVTDRAESNDTVDSKDDTADKRYSVAITRCIKENHHFPIADASICPYPEGEALFATIGTNQVNIYDLEVRGNYISTLLYYRNWHLRTMRSKSEVWRENLERRHPNELQKKTFNSLCWLRRWKDFWVCAADNEHQIHVLSVTFAKCLRLIPVKINALHLEPHRLCANVIAVIDMEYNCYFISASNGEIIHRFDDNICKIIMSDSGKRFVVVLENGTLREYKQEMHMKDKQLIVSEHATHNKKYNAQSHMRYLHENTLVVCNERGEFEWIELDTMTVVHRWKMNAVSEGIVCKFDVNQMNECVVSGNSDGLQIYDLKKKKFVRKVKSKHPFSYGFFCRKHTQSVLMVSGNVIMKYDPLELVEEYYPSTADFAEQTKMGQNCFKHVRTIEYDL